MVSLKLPSTTRYSRGLIYSPSKSKVQATLRENKDNAQKVYLTGKNEISQAQIQTVRIKRRKKGGKRYDPKEIVLVEDGETIGDGLEPEI